MVEEIKTQHWIHTKIILKTLLHVFRTQWKACLVKFRKTMLVCPKCPLSLGQDGREWGCVPHWLDCLAAQGWSGVHPAQLRAGLWSMDGHVSPFAPSFLKVLWSWFWVCIYVSPVYFTGFCYSHFAWVGVSLPGPRFPHIRILKVRASSHFPSLCQNITFSHGLS